MNRTFSQSLANDYPHKIKLCQWHGQKLLGSQMERGQVLFNPRGTRTSRRKFIIFNVCGFIIVVIIITIRYCYLPYSL